MHFRTVLRGKGGRFPNAVAGTSILHTRVLGTQHCARILLWKKVKWRQWKNKVDRFWASPKLAINTNLNKNWRYHFSFWIMRRPRISAFITLSSQLSLDHPNKLDDFSQFPEFWNMCAQPNYSQRTNMSLISLKLALKSAAGGGGRSTQATIPQRGEAQRKSTEEIRCKLQ